MEKKKEKKLLLKRFLTPRQICKLALEKGFVESCKKELSKEDLSSLLPKLAESVKDEELSQVLEEFGGARLRERIFRGKHYELLEGELELKSTVKKLKEDLRAAIRKHKWKSFYTLRCALELERFDYKSMLRCLAGKNIDYMPSQMLLLLTNKYRLLLRIKNGERKMWKVPEEERETIREVLNEVEDRITWYKRIRSRDSANT